MKVFLTIILFFLPFMTSCVQDAEMYIELSNTIDESRHDEMVELELKTIQTQLNLSDGQSFVISNAENLEIPYQITYDQKVIFLVDLQEKETVKVKVAAGTPSKPETISCGMIYPQRFDDLAWENDLVGFRAYGPSLQKRGEKAYGYDLFAKRGTHSPVLEGMYAMETDKIAWSEIRALREIDPEASETLRRSVTYHVDKGNGMDCYAVGPTLGAGVAALMDHEEIIYPWCYKKCEILDNGPLRFTARLEFTPLHIKGKEVIETREISLDAGSHLNKTTITYTNLTEPMTIASGIVLHDEEGKITASPDNRFMAYEDPTTGPNQGQLFLGHVFPQKVQKINTVYFSKEEVAQRNKAKGHLLAKDMIKPGGEFCYYWGFGWNKSDMQDYKLWINYLEAFARYLDHPILVKTIKN